MVKRQYLRNFGKLVFLAFVFSFVAYVMYDKPNDLETQPEFSEEETIFTSEQTNYTFRDSIVEYGMNLLGTPYVTAGNGKEGFDCSGYIYFVFGHFDIEVPRSTAGYENFGTEIPIEKVQKGDLLLFLSPTRDAIGHIGIVSTANGNESDFIHATSGSEMKVVITSLSNEGYTRRFVKAIRVL
jgi:cell wall-associated NlpC family hydrolase